MSTAPVEEVPARALVVTAHPDDVDFGAAGTVASWIAQGTEVTYCIVTDGDAGGFDPNVPRSEIPRIRRAEQVAEVDECVAVRGARPASFAMRARRVGPQRKTFLHRRARLRSQRRGGRVVEIDAGDVRHDCGFRLHAYIAAHPWGASVPDANRSDKAISCPQ